MEQAAGQRFVKLNVSPNDVFESFPTDFLGEGGKPEEGFADKELKIPLPVGELVLDVSYDGESELLAVIKDAPEAFDEDDVKYYLRDFLDITDDEEDEDEEDEDEEEEDEKETA